MGVRPDTLRDVSRDEHDCYSCGQDGNPDASPRDECPQSRKPCGHHCNHSWTHDLCHWCGEEWGDEEFEAAKAAA